MAFVKRNWLARIGTGLNKFLIGAPDGNGKQTLTNSPDSVTQQGDVISADNLNDLEDRIEAGFIAVESSLTGLVMWFTGNTGQIPTGYLVCNGQAVSRTTYARLYAVIGTKYGAGNGSTTFNLPDLSDGNGRFIRAGFTDTDIGSKQDDAIRNIGGYFGFAGGALLLSASPKGAFAVRGQTGNRGISSTSGSAATCGSIEFNANNDTDSYGNLMAGHANGADIHPYNIVFLPLIAY